MDVVVCLAFWVIYFVCTPPSYARRWQAIAALDEPSLMQRILPILCAITYQYPIVGGRLYHQEPRQRAYLGVVESLVWFTTPEMLERKYRENYRMSYLAFQGLLLELTPYIVSNAVNRWVRPPLDPATALKIVLYRLAHGHSPENMCDRFNVGASTIRKYTKIICSALSRDLFPKYIRTPTGQRLRSITEKFRDITGMQNMVGCIDGCHIPLYEKPDRRKTPAAADFWNRKSFHSLLLQAVCDCDRIFWDVYCGQPGGCADGGAFKLSSLYRSLRHRLILQEPVIDVRGVEVFPYIIGDSAYPIRSYLLKNFKPRNAALETDKIRFDRSMNKGRVLIENSFGILKNRWRILRSLTAKIDSGPPIVMACCVLHNYCQLMGMESPTYDRIERFQDRRDRVQGNRIPCYREGDAAKLAGERIRDAIFESWLERNPAPPAPAAPAPAVPAAAPPPARAPPPAL